MPFLTYRLLTLLFWSQVISNRTGTERKTLREKVYNSSQDFNSGMECDGNTAILGSCYRTLQSDTHETQAYFHRTKCTNRMKKYASSPKMLRIVWGAAPNPYAVNAQGWRGLKPKAAVTPSCHWHCWECTIWFTNLKTAGNLLIFVISLIWKHLTSCNINSNQNGNATFWRLSFSCFIVMLRRSSDCSWLCDFPSALATLICNPPSTPSASIQFRVIKKRLL